MRLSICIATFNRAAFIAETLDSILAQLTPDVEVVVVDGASTDATPELLASYAARHPSIDYRREAENCGVDRDFDKAVAYARGEYCWLMSDDDLIAPGAVAAVLQALSADPALLVVNAQIRTRELSTVLKHAQLGVAVNRVFGLGQQAEFFATCATYLTFIGAVVIRRAEWLARERPAYFGTQFIHEGVIFQRPIAPAAVLAAPCVQIRYGNASWSARGFDIWTRKWPQLAWSFTQFPEAVRARVVPRHPAASAKTLLWFRALGAFDAGRLRSLRDAGEPHHRLAGLIAAMPARFANAGVALYLAARGGEDARVMVYDLVGARCASWAARWAARRFRFPGTER